MRSFTTFGAAIALALVLSPNAAFAQAASARGLTGSGMAGPMTANGGVRDQFNAGRAIPYTRPSLGGVTRPAPPAGSRVYNHGYGYAGGYGGGYGGPPVRGRRDWVYDRPWLRHPYAPGPY